MSLIKILSSITIHDMAEKIVNMAIVDNAYNLIDIELEGTYTEHPFNYYVNIDNIIKLLNVISRYDKIDNNYKIKIRNWIKFNHWLNEYNGMGLVYDKALYGKIHDILGFEKYDIDFYLGRLVLESVN